MIDDHLEQVEDLSLLLLVVHSPLIGYPIHDLRAMVWYFEALSLMET